jgi:hypothetical protein
MNNLHPKTVEELYKICSINLSPNGVGQVGILSNLGTEPVLETEIKYVAVSRCSVWKLSPCCATLFCRT